MVGAITTLIVIVAVFLAYNANNGLPFVPTYQVSAEICDAARLGPNNEVRIGGNRVGVVESIDTVPRRRTAAARPPTVERLDRRQAQPEAGQERRPASRRLDRSGSATARRSGSSTSRSPVARARPGLPEGATLPLAQSSPQVEFDDVYNTFDTATRENSQRVLQGFGDAFAARGASLNEAIGALNPLFANLKPVSAGARRADHPARPLLPGARRRGPDRRSGRGRQRRAVHQRRDRLRRDLLRPAGAAGHDLRRAADPRGRARGRCPCSDRSSPTSPSSPGCCARASATCARRCRC